MAERMVSPWGLESTIQADNAWGGGKHVPHATWGGGTEALSSRPRKSPGNPARVGAGLHRDSFRTLGWRLGADTAR